MPDKDLLLWFFFRFRGRVGRVAFFLGGLLLAVLQGFFLYRFTLAPEMSQAGQAWALAFWIMFLVSIWANVALGVKRFHDLDRPGTMAFLLFIPVVSIIAFVALCFMPGTAGPNRYGPQPDRPTGRG